MPPVPNRRESERFGPADDQAWIGWWEGRIYRKSPATLINISQGGVKLISVSAPPRRSTTWICLEGMHQTEWVEGQVLELTLVPDADIVRVSCIRAVLPAVCSTLTWSVSVAGKPVLIAPAKLPRANASGLSRLPIVPVYVRVLL